MDTLSKICQEILSITDTDIQLVRCEIEIYTVEEGCGLKGKCFNSGNSIKSPLNVFKLNNDIHEWLWDWWNQTYSSENRWNKAELTVYKDGQYEVKTWWDSEFQISLYGEDN